MHQSQLFIALCLLTPCIVSQNTSASTRPTFTNQPPDFAGEDTPYGIIPTGTDIPPAAAGNVSVQNRIATWLYGYIDCDKIFYKAKELIDEGYYDSWLIAKSAGVASDIDWNSAAALEYLGPPGDNKNQRTQIQNVLANIATMYYGSYGYTPFHHYIKVRCDDPAGLCPKRKDPCRRPSLDPSSETIAYANNNDTDDGYPMINFCQKYFFYPSLKDAIRNAKNTMKGPVDMVTLMNRGSIFFHELCHIDIAANSPEPNPHIGDLTVHYREANSRLIISAKAYGPLLAKTLARWWELGFETGEWVQKNAENFAMFVLAKYVQNQEGVYPHLPLVSYEPARHPTVEASSYIAPFVTEGGDLYLNTTGLNQTVLDGWGVATTPGCSDITSSANDIEGNLYPPVSINGFAPASAYPDSYNSQVSSWISALATASTTASTAGATASSYANFSTASNYWKGICSFHLKETQTCVPMTKNLFAIINLKDGAGKDIGDTPAQGGSAGVGINDGAGYVFSSLLPYPLVITGEHGYDYIQFTYGDLSWQSKKPNGGGRCNVGGWEPRDGPVCSSRWPVFAVNNMDCFFPC